MSIPCKGLSDKLTRFLSDQSLLCDVKRPGNLQLVMLRGCKVNLDDSLSASMDPSIYTDHYDDVLIAYGIKSGGSKFLETFKASAKPGLAWVKHPTYASSAKGCPTVQPGQYEYCRGLHRGHEALRQVNGSPVCVIRDLNDNAKLEVTDLVDYPMYTGINIHAGGVSTRVGLNSSGCQVIYGGWYGEQWTRFHHLVYSVAKTQKVFHYTLVDFMTFGTWHDKGPVKMLMFGSQGDEVEDLQRRLTSLGYFSLKLVDGKFGRGTDRAVRAYQKSRGSRPTGIIKLI